MIECVHSVIGNLMRTSGLDITEAMIGDFIVNAVWAICSTYNTVFKSTNVAAIFGRKALFGIPCLTTWTTGTTMSVLDTSIRKKRIDAKTHAGFHITMQFSDRFSS
jgi:hypothetical protein